MNSGQGFGKTAIFAAAAIVLAGVVGASAGYKFKAQPTATAVVDVQEVFDSLKEKRYGRKRP